MTEEDYKLTSVYKNYKDKNEKNKANVINNLINKRISREVNGSSFNSNSNFQEDKNNKQEISIRNLSIISNDEQSYKLKQNLSICNRCLVEIEEKWNCNEKNMNEILDTYSYLNKNNSCVIKSLKIEQVNNIELRPKIETSFSKNNDYCLLEFRKIKANLMKQKISIKKFIEFLEREDIDN